MMKIGFILGTRPEIIKLYSCIQYCESRNIEYFVVNTDQHYDKNMRDIFFDEMGLKSPKYGLGVGSGSHSQMLAAMLPLIEDVLNKEKPDVVVVQGDTNTVLAGGLVANKMGIKLAHVEAGLRSYDRTMPEEYNRVIVDHCSDFLFAPTEKQKDILLKEGINSKSITVTGNTIVDAVEAIAHSSNVNVKKPFVLLTTHRPSNTDNREHLEAILLAMETICKQQDWDCILPLHPRLNSQRKFIEKFGQIKVVEPMNYSQLLGHIQKAEVIFTDSGGIQEEACILQRRCVILRTNTERPETVEVGGAVLLDEVTTSDILKKYDSIKHKKIKWYNPFGDGKAGQRIITTLQEALD